MSLIDIQQQAIQTGVKNSAGFRFMAQVNNFIKPEDLAKERKRFNAENLAGEGGGLLLFPSTYGSIQQIKSTPFIVDSEQMRLIQTNVANYFGVNERILQSIATADEMDSFYNCCLEPFAIQLSEVLAKMFYTIRERNQGNNVIVTADRLQYMSVKNKIDMAVTLGDRGMITINELRALFNYGPLPNGDRAPIRGEYYFSDEERNTDGGAENAD